MSKPQHKPQHNPVGFREFLIGDLFEIKLSDGDNRPSDLEPGIVPLISAGDSNNGIVGYFNSSTTIFKENSLTVDMFGYVYYQPKPFQTVSHGRVNILQIKNGEELSENTMLYLASAISKVTLQSEFGFSKMASSHRVKSLTIQLPVLANNQPDYEYMDYFVEELKHKYVEELDAWWSQAGFASLPDTLLTSNDRNVLNMYQHANKQTFTIDDLFVVKPSNTYGLTNDVLFDNGSNIVITNTVSNQGVGGMTSYEPNNDGNVISVSDTTMGGDTLFYRQIPFVGYSHVQVLSPKFELSENLAMFVIASVKKAVGDEYNYGHKFNREAIRETLIQMPVDINDQPDYDLISQYMQVMKKLTIQTHRAWLDEQLAEYQSLI